jgi:translation initiation factor IF-3
VPVPRRFDRRPPERDQTRINDRIRVPEVRLVGEDGKQIGVVKTSEALAYAQERDLDLVEVAPEARPPVCRVLDYSKYKYEQAQKLKAARKHQQQITIREIKFRPKIAQNDYDTKKGHVTRFLLDKLAGELAEIATVEQMPIQDGRNMTMMLGPSKAVLAGEKDKGHEDSHSESEAPAASIPSAEKKAPEPEATAPEPEATKPEPEATKPAPKKSAPEPEESAPEPAKSKPEAKTTEPAAEATEPQPEASTPEPTASAPSNGAAKNGKADASNGAAKPAKSARSKATRAAAPKSTEPA